MTDSAFPSIAQIAEATTLSEKSVRRALGDLLDWGIITKFVMPHHKPLIGRYPDKYDGRRYHIVPEMWDAAFLLSSDQNGEAAPQDESNMGRPITTGMRSLESGTSNSSMDELMTIGATTRQVRRSAVSRWAMAAITLTSADSLALNDESLA